jgi:WD40 repeat protein
MVDLDRVKDKATQELITSAVFNHQTGTSFLFTTSQGKINVCDFREHSDFHQRASVAFDSAQKTSTKTSVFNKWTNAVSSARFVGDCQIVSRDYLTVKLWDIRKASDTCQPVYSAQVTDYLERNLVSLMEHECLDDQFFCDVTQDGKHIATGGYNKSAHVLDINTTCNTVIPCTFGAPRDH